MKRIYFFTLTIAGCILTACAASATPAAPDDPTMNNPVNNNSPTAPQSADFLPRPADSKLSRGNVYLDSTELLTMESYPLQFTLELIGNTPTPCNHLRIAVNPPDTQNKIAVNVYSVVDPNTMCTQVLKPFNVNFPLGSFPGGHYTLWVNGKQIAEFDA